MEGNVAIGAEERNLEADAASFDGAATCSLILRRGRFTLLTVAVTLSGAILFFAKPSGKPKLPLLGSVTDVTSLAENVEDYCGKYVITFPSNDAYTFYCNVKYGGNWMTQADFFVPTADQADGFQTVIVLHSRKGVKEQFWSWCDAYVREELTCLSANWRQSTKEEPPIWKQDLMQLVRWLKGEGPQSLYKINPQKIVMTGWSSGGLMAARLFLRSPQWCYENLQGMVLQGGILSDAAGAASAIQPSTNYPPVDIQCAPDDKPVKYSDCDALAKKLDEYKQLVKLTNVGRGGHKKWFTEFGDVAYTFTLPYLKQLNGPTPAPLPPSPHPTPPPTPTPPTSPPPMPTPYPPTPAPPPPSPGPETCEIGDHVICETGELCAGNQCCSDFSTCPSADESFSGCPLGKTMDCVVSGPTPSPGPASCKVGDHVACPGGGFCAGNQCCSVDFSICPSADNSFSECYKGKTMDCTRGSSVVV